MYKHIVALSFLVGTAAHAGPPTVPGQVHVTATNRNQVVRLHADAHALGAKLAAYSATATSSWATRDPQAHAARIATYTNLTQEVAAYNAEARAIAAASPMRLYSPATTRDIDQMLARRR